MLADGNAVVTKIGVCGAAGRMGKTILQVCEEESDVKVGAAIEHQLSPVLGHDAGEQAGIGHIAVEITDDIAKIVEQVDVLIDFTIASSLSENLAKSHVAGKPMVIGTTGLNKQQHQYIKSVAQDIPILWAANMSLGINLCLKLLKITAQAIGGEMDIEIIEAHHKHKKDAPSGTALHMGEIIATALGRDLQDCATYNRQCVTAEREKNSIGFQTIRAGDIVGEHTVMFAGTGERIEISHKSSSRKNFAHGAIRAAQWLKDQDKGLFDMQDVLSL